MGGADRIGVYRIRGNILESMKGWSATWISSAACAHVEREVEDEGFAQRVAIIMNTFSSDFGFDRAGHDTLTGGSQHENFWLLGPLTAYDIGDGATSTSDADLAIAEFQVAIDHRSLALFVGDDRIRLRRGWFPLRLPLLN